MISCYDTYNTYNGMYIKGVRDSDNEGLERNNPGGYVECDHCL